MTTLHFKITIPQTPAPRPAATHAGGAHQIFIMNVIHLIGNLGADPEKRTLDSGSTVVNFSLATSETYKDRNGEKQTITQWHRINFWGAAADVLHKYLRKGSKVQITGQMTYRKYTDKDGIERHTAEVKGRDFNFIDSGNRDEGSAGQSQTSARDRDQPNYNQGSQANTSEEPMPALTPDEDLPF